MNFTSTSTTPLIWGNKLQYPPCLGGFLKQGHSMTIRNVLQVFVIACTAASSVQAQTAHVGAAQLRLGNWTFVPVLVSETENAPGKVVEFLALADKQTVAPGSIVAVQYTRLAGTDEWSMQAWTEENQWVAIEHFKTAYGMSVPDTSWPTIDPKPQSVPNVNPVPYAKGVLLSDPVAPLVAVSAERDAIVAFLADAGYQAADVPVERLSVAQCGAPVSDTHPGTDVFTSPELSIIANAVELGEQAAESEDKPTVVGGDIVLQTQLRARCCFPWVTVGPWGPCVPSGSFWQSSPSTAPGGLFVCEFTQIGRCTRTRTWVFVWPNCSTTSVVETVSEDTVLQEIECYNVGGTTCPPSPPPGC